MQTGFSGNSGRCSSKVQSILGNPPDLGMGLGDRWETGVYDISPWDASVAFTLLRASPQVARSIPEVLHPFPPLFVVALPSKLVLGSKK